MHVEIVHRFFIQLFFLFIQLKAKHQNILSNSSKIQKEIFSQIQFRKFRFSLIHTWIFWKYWEKCADKNAKNQPFRLIVSVELNISIWWRFSHHIQNGAYHIVNESGKWEKERKMCEASNGRDMWIPVITWSVYTRYSVLNGEKLCLAWSTTDDCAAYRRWELFRTNEITSLRIVNRFSTNLSALSIFQSMESLNSH